MTPRAQADADEMLGLISHSDAAAARAQEDAHAADRAALVAALRQLADWFEWHAEVIPPTYPDFPISVAQSGQWTKDDSECRARIKTVADALGVEVSDDGHGHVRAEQKFGPLRIHAFHIAEVES